MSESGKRRVPKPVHAPASAKPKWDWDDLRVFNAVAEHGTMAGAARVLGVTASMVSKRIDDLEARLGATLLSRHAHGVSLTETGKLVRDYALTMEHSAASIERMAGAQDKRRAGRVTIQAPDGVAAFWIAPRIADFIRENPKIRIAVDCGFWSERPLPDPPDLIISVKEEKRLDYVATRLAVLHYVLFASPKYLDTYGAPLTLANVADHRFLDFTPISEQPENWHERASSLRGLAEASLETNSSAMLLHTLLAGGGIAVAPSAVRSFARDLVVVYPEAMSHIRLYLVHHQDAVKSARVRAVAEWIKAIFDPRVYPWFRDEYVPPDQFPDAASS
ncbi:MAG TPA: LysR family transcriptional regulator [Caulobacterales bacterium]|nr:LysR family transcriptional regulator [Caulobacterales bacterium]